VRGYEQPVAVFQLGWGDRSRLFEGACWNILGHPPLLHSGRRNCFDLPLLRGEKRAAALHTENHELIIATGKAGLASASSPAFPPPFAVLQ